MTARERKAVPRRFAMFVACCLLLASDVMCCAVLLTAAEPAGATHASGGSKGSGRGQLDLSGLWLEGGQGDTWYCILLEHLGV